MRSKRTHLNERDLDAASCVECCAHVPIPVECCVDLAHRARSAYGGANHLVVMDSLQMNDHMRSRQARGCALSRKLSWLSFSRTSTRHSRRRSAYTVEKISIV